MAILNTRFYRKEDDALYSDGAIEDIMYDRVTANDSSLENDREWAVFYHFSPIRQNILNWYPFEENCSILEIGAGCGALTGMLAQRAAHVTACELTMNRARILYQRHKNLDNIEIYVGNFLSAVFEKQFDYIIINGVLEYSRGIMGDMYTNPFVAFLEHAKSFLKPNGIILLSIENRIGLKYIAGAPEDHVGKIFSGINGYKGEKVKTFSKSELQEICDSAKLKVHRWYYPYPDYKFPTEIFTDDSVNIQKPISYDIPFDMTRVKLFNERTLYELLMKDGIAGNFSNSFLLELGNGDGKEKAKPTYIKISNNRKKEFAVCTILYEKDGLVEKKALYQEGRQHIQKMARETNSECKLEVVPYHLNENDVLRYRMIREKSLREILEELILKNRITDFWDMMSTLYSGLFEGELEEQTNDSEFSAVFGPERIQRKLHWKNNVNIDLNIDNIFCTGQQWRVIDNEWVFSFKVPVEYAAWRILVQMQQEKTFENIMTAESINNFLKIGTEEVRIFQKWEIYFAKHYVGIEDLSNHYQQVFPLNMDVVLEEQKKNNIIVSHLFVFMADGDVEILDCAAVNQEGVWSVRFESENFAAASSIRWDPLEGSACRISDINAGDIEVVPNNADMDEVPFTFATFDPQFTLIGEWKERTNITISFRCQLLDWTAGFYKLEVNYNHEREMRQHEEALRGQLYKDFNHLNSEKAQQQQMITELKEEIAEAYSEKAQQQQMITKLKEEVAEAYEMLQAEKKIVLERKAYLDNLKYQVTEHKLQSVWRIITSKLL